MTSAPTVVARLRQPAAAAARRPPVVRPARPPLRRSSRWARSGLRLHDLAHGAVLAAFVLLCVAFGIRYGL